MTYGSVYINKNRHICQKFKFSPIETDKEGRISLGGNKLMKLAALLLPAVALLYLFLPKQVETDDKTYSYSLKSTEQIRTELKSRSFKRASEREPRPTHIVYKNLRRDSNDGQNHRAPLAVKSYKQKYGVCLQKIK